MYIDEDKKFIFFHVPKTGGKTIKSILNSYCIKTYNQNMYTLMTIFFNKNSLPDTTFYHMSFSKLTEILPEYNWDTYTKFCFIRNPYTRLYSHWLEACQNNGASSISKAALNTNGNFNKFVQQLMEEEIRHAFHVNYFYTHHKKQPIMDFIGRFETYENDLKEIFRIIDIPYMPIHANKRGDNDYLKFYTANSIRIVNQYAAKSFEVFGYEMLDSKDFPEELPTNL